MVVALLGAAAAVGLVAVVVCQSPTVSAAAGSAPVTVQPQARLPIDRRHGLQRRAAGAADGVVPDGVSVFDTHYPAVTKLDPALLRALRRAATDAARSRVELYVDSGWRSPAYQEQLFSAAVSKYGSKKKAAQWVAPPGTSAHESGDAVDIGHSDATAWLA